MIGIKGIAKKPIIDATANPEDVASGKIFYNNSGKTVGTSKSILKEFTVTVPSGTYTSTTTQTTYTCLKGNLAFCAVYEKYDVLSISSFYDRTVPEEYQATGIIDKNNGWYTKPIYIVDGILPNDISSIYRPCGISYNTSDTDGNTLSHVSRSVIYSSDLIESTNFKWTMYRYASVKYNDSYRNEGFSDQVLDKNVLLNLFIYRNYYAVTATIEGNSTYQYRLKSAKINAPFTFNILLTQKKEI